MKTRAAIYCRISKQEPGTPKVEEQESRCREQAAQLGYEVVGVYVDDGISAYRSKVHRPSWAELRQAITSSTFDVLLFDRQDRLERDQFATLRLMADCGERGIRWHSVTEGAIDLTQSPQLLMAAFRGTDAESYSRKIQENVRRRNATDRAKGLPGSGPRPFGYDRSRMVVVEEEANLIREAVAMLLAGASKWEVVKLFNDSGLPTTRKRMTCPKGSCGEDQTAKERAACPEASTHEKVDVFSWRASAVYDAVGRWRNAGMVEHQGQRVGKGVWEPIVLEEELRSVRAILEAPSRVYGGRPPQTLLTNLAFCHCGERMHAHGMQWGRVYRCASMDTQWDRNDFIGKHTAIKIKLLDDLARKAVVSSYLIASDAALAVDSQSGTIAELHVAKAELQRRNSVLIAALTGTTSAMSMKSFRAQEAKFDVEAREIQKRLDAAARSSAHAQMMVEARRKLFEDERPDGAAVRIELELAGGMRHKLGARFDALSLVDQRRLVGGAVRLTVFPGWGVKRVAVNHLLAPSLDDNDAVGLE